MKKVTTVLSVVNRLPYLNSQLDSINNQTVDSDIFIIWRNKERYSLSYPCIIYENESKHFNSLYGRFYNSIHIKTPYVFIVDDDILPGSEYVERCINFSKQNNDKVAVCTFGVNFASGETKYNPVFRVDQNLFLDNPLQVDMGGQGWFMKTELLYYFLYQPPVDLTTGEDLHFSYCLFKNNIPIYVLDKDKNNLKTWQDVGLGKRGEDDKAQWKTNPNHFPVRDKLMEIYTSLGWEFKSKKTII
jgi:hypothetical protein